MAAEYKLVRNPNPKKDGSILPMHPRLVSCGTFSIEDMMSDMKGRSSFSSADIKGMLQLIQDMMFDYLLMGANVELDGIGTFSLSLKCRPVMDKKEIRSESIHFRTINFRPSVQLCNRLRYMPVYRAEEDKSDRIYDEEECRKRLLRYLDNNQHITRKRYMRLNNCSRSKACLQLQKFYKEGIISRHGQGPTTFYMRNKE